jgi:hypothetical protein
VTMGCPNPCEIERASGVRGSARDGEEEWNEREDEGWSTVPEFGEDRRRGPWCSGSEIGRPAVVFPARNERG